MAQATSNRTTATKPRAAAGAKRLRAIICDDDALSRRLVTATVEKHGFEVIAELDSAGTAATAASMTKADLIVLDHALVGMSGTDAIPSIRSLAPECSILVFSAFDMVHVSLTAGAHAVVRKGNTAGLDNVVGLIAEQKRAAR